jgi:hypothetical protein
VLPPSEVRIAYIVLAHSLPRQLCRLVERLDGDQNLFLVHVDRRAPQEVFAEALRGLGSNPRVVFLPRRSSRRTTFALVAAPLEALRTLIGRDHPFDYAILLSGQDYPIKPQRSLGELLAEDPEACFLHAFPIEDPEHSDWPPHATFRYRNWHLGLGSRRWSLPLNRRIPSGRVPYGGSMYWALPRSAVEYMLATVEREPRLVTFFKHTFVPDEMFFQTILMNSPLRDRVTSLAAPDCYGLHHIDWQPNRDRPETLGISTLPALRSSPAFFARKFDASVDDDVLDRIDAELLAGG